MTAVHAMTDLAVKDDAVISNVATQADDTTVAAALDIAEGIERVCGDEALYFSLLRSFAASRHVDVTQIDDALRRGDVTLAREKVHALAGVAANLSATALCASIVELQSALKSSEPSVTSSALARLRAAMDALVVIVEGLEPSGSASARNEPYVGGDCGAALRSLGAMLDRHELAAEEQLREVRQYVQVAPHGNLLDAIEAQLRTLDFAAAACSLRALVIRVDAGC
jgi:two-component system, sensor histidine kinase and response regulator